MRRQLERQKKNSNTSSYLISIKNDFACDHTFLYISLQLLLLQDDKVKLSSYTFYEGDVVQLYESHKHIETSEFLFAFFFTAAHFYLNTGH